jgi:thiol-disulfide isomerase/thioredoxin
MRTLLLLFIGTLLMPMLQAQEPGYHISIGIDNYEKDSLFLGYYYGDKQYLRDTAIAGAGGKFVFTGEEPLPGGMYLVVMPPDNDYFQLVINEGEQEFAVHTSRENPVNDITIEGSPDNQLFYDYLHFLNAQRPRAEALQKKMAEATEGSAERQEVEQQLETINEEVTAYQQRIVREHPNTMTGAIVRANRNADMPEFTGTPEEQQEKRWRYMQEHWFDDVDLSDPRLLRTPFLFDKIDTYVHKLQVQHPDTIARAIDYVLEKTGDAEETFRFYLVHYLNEAARSNIVGMDAVYVHLVENYYKKGLADWSDEESLKKILENSEALKPLLIGKTAPNLLMQKRDGSKIALHDVDSKYTVLYFWRYDCSHCKKATPHMKAFYDEFKDKGVELFAVCVKYTDDVSGCWDYIDENEIGDWLHTVDPYNLSKFATVYNIKSTPQIYILDRNKEILSKGIGAEQLEEVMNNIIEMDAAGDRVH